MKSVSLLRYKLIIQLQNGIFKSGIMESSQMSDHPTGFLILSDRCNYLKIDVNELLPGDRLTMEQYKESAERNLLETLSNSSFTLKEKIEFYKKK